MFGVIVAVVFSNIVAVLLGTEGVYESELESQLQVNYLAQVRLMMQATACLASKLRIWRASVLLGFYADVREI